MEMSHRGKEFTSIAQRAEADLRELMGIPANYKVLFLQGEATQPSSPRFPSTCWPALRTSGRPDYIVTGSWSKRPSGNSAGLR